MYGAILGDIIGSPYEFDGEAGTKNFELFNKNCRFTDDTVMTMAVTEALLAAGRGASVQEIESVVTESMQAWGRRYPNAGYGGSFIRWLKTKNPAPYYSYGNGSAMRVSAAGWLYDSMERTRAVARATAEVTHNHPEGIKGAEAVASAIYLARNKADKRCIKSYIKKEFNYNLDRKLDKVRSEYYANVSCQQTVPEAIIAFLESTGFEDAIRNAVSLGGDTDTLGAITGSIAEAYYGIPQNLLMECRTRIDAGLMTDILDEFDCVLGRDVTGDMDAKTELMENCIIESAIRQYCRRPDENNMKGFILSLANRMQYDGEFIVPYTAQSPIISVEQLTGLKTGDKLCLDHDVKLKPVVGTDNDENEWIMVFTSLKEIHKGSIGNVYINRPIISMLKTAENHKEIYGIMINYFGQSVHLNREMIEYLIGLYENCIQ